MHESTARKRKASSRTRDYDVVEHTKYVRTFCFLSARHTASHSQPLTADRPATEFFQILQILSINYPICHLIFFVPGTHTIFPGLLESQTGCGEQYSHSVRRIALGWLGQSSATRHLPGWSTSTYIGLEADTPKRDAVVEAFRVRPMPSFTCCYV